MQSRPGTLLQREDADRKDWVKILGNSKTTVTRLNNVVAKHKSLGRSRKGNWDRLRLANNNLGEMRSKLNLHISVFTAYLDTISVSALGRIEHDVRGLLEMKDTVDELAAAARAGRCEGSVMTDYESDDKAIWREFRREFISEGFSSESIHKYKPQLKQYLRDLQAGGLLDEEVPSLSCGPVAYSDL